MKRGSSQNPFWQIEILRRTFIGIEPFQSGPAGAAPAYRNATVTCTLGKVVDNDGVTQIGPAEELIGRAIPGLIRKMMAVPAEQSHQKLVQQDN